MFCSNPSSALTCGHPHTSPRPPEPPAEVTSLLQHCQEAKPADTKPSGQILHVDWILEHSPRPRLDFTVAVPRGPRFGPFLVAFMAMKMLLLLPSDISMVTGWHSDPRKGSCDASQRCHQDTAPTPGKANSFPFPGQAISRANALRAAFKNQVFLSFSFTQDQQQKMPQNCCPRAANCPLVTSGKEGWTGLCKVPRSCNRARGEAAACFLK